MKRGGNLKRTPLRRKTRLKATTSLRRGKPDVAMASWSKAVREKDGDLCKACGELGCDPHHIRPRSVAPERKYDVSNGTILCRACHSAVHDHRPINAMVKSLIARKTEKAAARPV